MADGGPSVREKALRRVSSSDWAHDADLERASKAREAKRSSGWGPFVALTYQSVGVVYGDLGTSPLYLWPTVFDHVPDEEDALGALCLVLWTITLIMVIKYVFIVLFADDNSEGGTFAVYNLLCRACNISPFGTSHSTDKMLSKFDRKESAGKSARIGAAIASALEAKVWLQKLLLFIVLIGTCALIGDGVLTPAISVVSSISGLQAPDQLLDSHRHPKVSNDAVVGVSCAVLILLFLGQKYGTTRIGIVFAPIILAWFLVNSSIGIYNIHTFYPGVFKAFSPYYGYKYFARYKTKGWVSLGGVLLCITGAEAMYADMGHFSANAIRASSMLIVYPSMLLIYLGQGAYLVTHPTAYEQLYFKAIPAPIFWPTFVIAVLAAIVASQSVLTGTFSIVHHSMSLNCFPRVKVVNTSNNVKGQVYVPEINYMLMALGLACILFFTVRQSPHHPVNTHELGNAYGVAVLVVMLITTALVTMVMLVVWQASLWLVVPFFTVFFFIEAVFFSANLFKVPNGGWVPLLLASVFLGVSYLWHWGTTKRLHFHMAHDISLEQLLQPLSEPEDTLDLKLVETGERISRMRGVAVFYSDTLDQVPLTFKHMIRKCPAIHQVLIFITIRQVPVPSVAVAERILIKEMEYLSFYRVVARYGYMDKVDQGEAFVQDVIEQISEFLTAKMAVAAANPDALTLVSLPVESEGAAAAADTPPEVISPAQLALDGTASADDVTPRVPSLIEAAFEGSAPKAEGEAPPRRTPSATIMRTRTIDRVGGSHRAKSIDRPQRRASNGVRRTSIVRRDSLPGADDEGWTNVVLMGDSVEHSERLRKSVEISRSTEASSEVNAELATLLEAQRHGVVYFRSRPSFDPVPGSSRTHRILTHWFSILKATCRPPTSTFSIPTSNLLEIGMVYEI